MHNSEFIARLEADRTIAVVCAPETAADHGRGGCRHCHGRRAGAGRHWCRRPVPGHPGIRPEVAKVAADDGIPFSLGALTPSEVAMALDLGSAVVKIFPARARARAT